jgi:Fe-Mn family superoxide dismutase
MILQPGSRPVPNSPDYILIRKLGAGAFGEVWHAHGPGGLDVALKFIRLDAHVFALELRSLEVMKSIRHPNLVSLFGAWHQDNWLILAMELCDRTVLDRLAEALYQKLPGIPLQELLSYMADAANGLDALNAKQVQHRDVKPANLLLLNSGVKVADFGLAKALEQTVASNSGAGTLAYTAPECFKGQLTQQSDQYSLAVTYYHLRTGHLLFKGDQAQVMYAHLEVQPDLSRLPPAEGAILARALTKEPHRRWRNCKAFVNELFVAANLLMSSAMIDLIGSESHKPFTLPPLPYSTDALEGAIDKVTMQIHHGRHHKAYVDNLNRALEGQPGLASKSIVQLMSEINTVPLNIRQAVINSGGGHANHSMFWEIMGPSRGGEPSGALAQAIKSTFGDFAHFKYQMKLAALGRVGSGWAWLVLAEGKLKVCSYAHEDSPLMNGATPILGIDVWEHAYYLRYQKNLADYVEAWWKVVNWNNVAKRFGAGTQAAR